MAHVTSRDSSTRKTKSRHPPTAAGRSSVRTDALRLSTAAVHSQKSDRCCQRQRLSFIRRGVVPNRLSRKRNALKGLIGRPFRASKAHRLPKSVGYVSARPRQVKQKWLKTRAFGAFGNRIPSIRRPAYPLYCDVTPATLMTLRYFELSRFTNALNSATAMGVTTAPAASSAVVRRERVRGAKFLVAYAASARRSLRSTGHKSDWAYE
jgi:hypothetical protein